MSRDITQLHPKLQEKIAQLKALCAQQGINLGIADCMRNQSEQADCVARGTSSVRYPNSHHNWGTAFDFFNNVTGDSYNENIMNRVGVLGQSIGLEWGGGWTSPVDKPHFQLPDWGTGTATLKATYGTPNNFRATWGSYQAQQVDTSKYLQIYELNNSIAQKWMIETGKDGISRFWCKANMQYVDVVNNGYTNGTYIQTYKGNNTTAQNWIIKKIEMKDKVIGGIEAYEFIPVKNGNMRLDVSGANTKNGTKVQLYKSNNSDAQRWYIRPTTDGFYNIINVGSGKCLDLPNAGK